MGWPADHPEKGDYSGVQRTAAVLDELVEWLTHVKQLVQSASQGVGEAWQGEAAKAFVDRCARADEIVLANRLAADDATQALRRIVDTMETQLFPEALRYQLKKRAAEEDLARVQRLSRATGGGDLLSQASGQVEYYQAQISAATSQLKEIGDDRRREAAVAAEELNGMAFRSAPFGDVNENKAVLVVGNGAEELSNTVRLTGIGSPPPRVPTADDSTLQKVLDQIYAGSKNPFAIGDGKLATALLNEIKTGNATFGKWHAVDCADQLTRLVDLLETDRKPNNNFSLSAADRVTALAEADELWKAINTPLSKDSPLYKELSKNPTAQQTMMRIEIKFLEAPSVASISGTEFEMSTKGRPVPKTTPRLGSVMSGAGAILAAYDFYTTVRAVFDPSYARTYLCQTFPSAGYCDIEVPLA